MAEMTPGQLARDAREASGFTREHLAAVAQISVATIARLENQGAVPSFANLIRISAHTGLDLDALASAIAAGEGVVWPIRATEAA